MKAFQNIIVKSFRTVLFGYSVLFTTVMSVLLAVGTAQADTNTWSNAGTAWATGANWVGGTAPADNLTQDMAFFNGTITQQPNTSTRSVAGIIVGDGALTTSALTFSGTLLSLGAGGITINPYVGTVTLSATSVKLGASQTWLNNSGSLTGSANISNVGDVAPFILTIDGTGVTTLSGIISNGGNTGTLGLTKNGVGTLTLSGANTYTGATILNDGTLNLQGLNGVLALSTSPITLAGGLFSVVNAAVANNNARLADTQAISLSGGRFLYNGAASAGVSSTETVGAITSGSGASSIGVAFGNATGAATLTAASLAHNAGNAALLVNGAGLGKDTASLGSVGRLFLTSAPTLVGTTAATATGINSAAKNTQIVPYLLGEATATSGNTGTVSGVANTFLTYHATTGLRPLNLTDEFTANTITVGNNMYITAATTAVNTASINALVMNGNNLTITDGKTLTVASGAVLFSAGNTIKPSGSSGTLDFGSAEAMVTVNGTIATISAPITGSGGLTKSGIGTLVLSGTNSFTGKTTVGAGMLSIAATNSLPGWATSGGFSVARGTALTVGNAVTDASIDTLLGTGNFDAGASFGFDTSAGNRTYNAVLTNTLGVAKIGTNTLTLGAASTVAGLLVDGASGGVTLNENLTTTSLNLQNTTGGAAGHTNTIAAGKTLTVNGSMIVGNTVALAGVTTTNYFTGGGTLAVAGTNLYVGGWISTSSYPRDVLNLSGLNTFTCTVNNMGVGYAINGNVNSLSGALLLAATNTITATKLYLGGTGNSLLNSGSFGLLVLGALNTLNVNNISAPGVSMNRQTTTIMFNSDLAVPGKVLIRGSAGGSSTAAVTLGYQGTGTGNYHQQADFTGGILDAMFGDVRLQGTGQGLYHTAVMAIGQTAGAGADFTGGTLTIGEQNNSQQVGSMHPEFAFYIGATNGTATMTAGIIKVAKCDVDGAMGYFYGTLTVGTNSTVTVTNSIVLGIKGTTTSNGVFATLNLNAGGTLVIPAGGIITTSMLSGASTGVTTNSINFDGGTLRLSSSGNLISGNNAGFSLNIQPGGATFDTGTNSMTITQNLLSAVGSGIGSIVVTNGGSGFYTAPYVVITDTTGSGAGAFAQINNAGRVTNIVLTSRGQNYTSPAISLVSGNGTSAAVSNKLVAVTGGGLTKLGTGTLTLSGVNTYTGPTIVSNGVLRLTQTQGITTNADVVISADGKMNLDFAGITTIRSLTVNGELKTRNAVYNKSNLPALSGTGFGDGSLQTTEGSKPKGTMIRIF
ncbi:MAG: autotransporter-associated beta strand repeat-containing protein [bacterium]